MKKLFLICVFVLVSTVAFAENTENLKLIDKFSASGTYIKISQDNKVYYIYKSSLSEITVKNSDLYIYNLISKNDTYISFDNCSVTLDEGNNLIINKK